MNENQEASQEARAMQIRAQLQRVLGGDFNEEQVNKWLSRLDEAPNFEGVLNGFERDLNEGKYGVFVHPNIPNPRERFIQAWLKDIASQMENPLKK